MAVYIMYTVVYGSVILILISIANYIDKHAPFFY